VIEYRIFRSPASRNLRSSSRCPTKIIAHPTRALYVVAVVLANREFHFRQHPSGSWTLNRKFAARLQASRSFSSLVSSSLRTHPRITWPVLKTAGQGLGFTVPLITAPLGI